MLGWFLPQLRVMAHSCSPGTRPPTPTSPHSPCTSHKTAARCPPSARPWIGPARSTLATTFNLEIIASQHKLRLLKFPQVLGRAPLLLGLQLPHIRAASWRLPSCSFLKALGGAQSSLFRGAGAAEYRKAEKSGCTHHITRQGRATNRMLVNQSPGP